MKIRFPNKTLLTLAALAVTLLLPVAAQAGIADVLSLLSSITATLRNAVGPVLNSIHTVETQVSALEQQVLWPATLMAEAKNVVAQIRVQFSGLAAQIHAIDLRSATLPGPSQLEALVRSRDSGNLDQISPSYRDVFLALPPDRQATAQQRELIDIDDAFALEAMKTATVADAAGQRSLGLADALEQQASTAAPGSAPMLAAQAHVASLQNQAMLQKLLATQLRQEAAGLAHANALRKHAAQSVHHLRDNLLHILQRH